MVAAGAGIIVAMGAMKSTPKIEPEVDSLAPKVSTMRAAPQTKHISVSSQGMVLPAHKIELVSEVAGRVIAVTEDYADGGFFTKGQAIVTIDDRDYRFALLQAEAELAKAEELYAIEKGRARQAKSEWRNLGDTEVNELFLRKPQLASAQAALQAAQAMRDKAELTLERTRISAPFDGRINLKNVDVGQYVSPGAIIAQVYSTESVLVRLPLTDKQVAKEELPLTAKSADSPALPSVVLSSVYGGKYYSWNGTIVRTEGSFDVKSRVVYAVAEVKRPYVSVPNSNKPPLSVGMYVAAEIIGREMPDVVTLPRKALHKQHQVIIVNSDNTLLIRNIDVLNSNGDGVVVTGLNAGERVLLTRVPYAVDGFVVAPIVENTPEHESDIAEAPSKLGAEADNAKREGQGYYSTKSTLAWFVNNSIAANLIMFMILVGGIVSLFSLNKELFPTVSEDVVEISVPYLGAGPREVEEQICIRIEEAIQDLEGIKKIRSEASFGYGQVWAEIDAGYDIQKLCNDIKTRVDAINTFPSDSERPQITQAQQRQRLLRVAISGEIDERTLKDFGQQVRDEMAELNHVDIVNLNAVRADEVSIEVSEFDLRRYQITFDDVVNAIRQTSINLPAGVIRSSAGDFQIQTRGQAYTQNDFESIPLHTNTDGTQIFIGDVAKVVDGFADTNIYTRFDGTHAVFIDVFGASNPDVIKTSESVNAYVQGLQDSLPPGISFSVWSDLSFMFKGRMNLLAGNAFGGLAPAFIILMLFLRPKLAL
ncbi:MAG: RND family efflux transporter MFP subunit [Lentisphaeria bacterium]|jgi:RND family efflux transporter MFP subunit